MQEETAHVQSSPEAHPNWAALDREILCPLCDYNLRGLTEPRCPECGHRSTWEELLDPTRAKHPWLFEHAQQRRARALAETFVRSQLPTRFWKAVQPTHRPRAGRLLLYGCIVNCLLVIQLGTPFLVEWARFYQNVNQSRRAMSEILQSGIPGQGGQYRIAPMPKAVADARAAAAYPHFMLSDVSWEVAAQHPAYRMALQVLLMLLLWGPLTILSLLIFQRTLQRAKIRALHVVRCVVYAMDSAVLVAWPLTFAIKPTLDPLTNATRIVFTPYVLIVLAGITGLFAYRLSCAYRHYLRFPAPIWTCVASQVIVLLALIAIMPWMIMFDL